ncbi:SRPBCC domain-containing protein [uncultured Cohaesibacter sp.]|uniref:SRPBCC domain-containing protein n=1 Tax=uncultured Cohaesibacter sp. TaxID=1002546 RepID=UPI00292D7D2D|nr:SRPBCC domain-containing protein [uncultured Cohaesibacter sp.]
MLKPVVKVIEVPIDAPFAYRLFTSGIASWWPLDTRSISAHSVGKPAKTIEADPIPGGAIIEISADDTRYVWGNFADCAPPFSLAIDFHMGQPKEHNTLLAISFLQMEEHQTLVKLVHSGWDCFGPLAQMMREGYDRGWDEIFCNHYAQACQKGRFPESRAC